VKQFAYTKNGLPVGLSYDHRRQTDFDTQFLYQQGSVFTKHTPYTLKKTNGPHHSPNQHTWKDATLLRVIICRELMQHCNTHTKIGTLIIQYVYHNCRLILHIMMCPEFIRWLIWSAEMIHWPEDDDAVLAASLCRYMRDSGI